MLEKFLLKTPVYVMDEGSGGALWLFLMAILGAGLFVLGKMSEESSDSCLGSLAGGFMAKMGVGIFLTGIISGIISLF